MSAGPPPQVFRTDHCLAVVTDHVPGGTLFRHVTSRGRLREESARTLFRQLLSGLGHCHSQVPALPMNA